MTTGLTAELQKFVANGGSLVIFPAKKPDLISYTEAFKSLQLPVITGLDTSNTKTQTINFEQGLYEGVFEKIDQKMDLPKVYEHYQFAQSIKSNSQNVIVLQNGNPFLSQHVMQNGKNVFIFCSVRRNVF